MSTYDADAVSDFTNHLFHSSFQPVTITAQHSNKNLYAQFKFTLQTISRFIRFFKSIRNQMKSEAIWSSASLFPSIFFAQQKQRYEKQRCLLRPPASDHRKTVIAAFIRVYTITSIARLISLFVQAIVFWPCALDLRPDHRGVRVFDSWNPYASPSMLHARRLLIAVTADSLSAFLGGRSPARLVS